jgi:hypothetical protein
MKEKHKLVGDNSRNILATFAFKWLSIFREDFKNIFSKVFSSKGSHFELMNDTKKQIFVEVHPRNNLFYNKQNRFHIWVQIYTV